MRHRVDNMAQSVADQRKMDKYRYFIFEKNYPNHLKIFIYNPNKFILQVCLYNFNQIQVCTVTNNQKKHKKENPKPISNLKTSHLKDICSSIVLTLILAVALVGLTEAKPIVTTEMTTPCALSPLAWTLRGVSLRLGAPDVSGPYCEAIGLLSVWMSKIY